MAQAMEEAGADGGSWEDVERRNISLVRNILSLVLTSSQVGMNSHVAAMGLANVAKRAIKLNRNSNKCLPDSKMTLNGRKRSGL